jgi:outer membrane PBP1 activator LpoA protein
MDMKHLRLLSLLVCAGLLAACETNDNAGGPGRAEKREMAKRQAAQQRQQESPQDEAQQNLWRTQQNMLNRDSNSTRP